MLQVIRRSDQNGMQAGNQQGRQQGNQQRSRQGNQAGNQNSGRGQFCQAGNGNGNRQGGGNLLSAKQSQDLALMREEEKLARDVYVAMNAKVLSFQFVMRKRSA